MATEPNNLPLAPLMGIDQTARKPESSTTWRRSAQCASLATSATNTSQAEYTAAAHEPRRGSMGVRSRTAASIGGSWRAMVSEKQLRVGRQHRDRAAAARIHRLHQRRDHVEHRRQAGVGGQQREERALVLHDDLGALAFGDVGDAGAHQRLRAALQAHQAHFAGNVAAGGVAMDPLEHLRLARGRELQVLARRRIGGLPVGLDLGADRIEVGLASNWSRVILNRRSAGSLASMKRLVSGSMTVMASGALSTSER